MVKAVLHAFRSVIDLKENFEERRRAWLVLESVGSSYAHVLLYINCCLSSVFCP